MPIMEYTLQGSFLKPVRTLRSMGRPRVKVTVSKDEVGRRVKAARMRAGYSQMKLAEVLEITQARVSDIERGARKPTLQQLARMSRALKIPMEQLLVGQGETASDDRQDPRFLKRLQQIAELQERDKQVLLHTIDTFLKASKAS
jgi:transcriptional regulator with XRE-family HTH domain